MLLIEKFFWCKSQYLCAAECHGYRNNILDRSRKRLNILILSSLSHSANQLAINASIRKPEYARSLQALFVNRLLLTLTPGNCRSPLESGT